MRETSLVRPAAAPPLALVHSSAPLIPLALQRRRLRVTGGAEGAGMRPIKEEEGDGRTDVVGTEVIEKFLSEL